jgi:hypothetical protein
MATNGLLTEVRWEWYGTELSADEAASQTILSVVNASALSLDQVIWVGTSGPYTIIDIDYDNDIITVDLALPGAFDAGTEVVPDIGGQPGQMWLAEVILQDAEDPIEVPLKINDLLSMPEGTYDPPVSIIISDDLENVIDLPGTLPSITSDYVPGMPTPDDGKTPSPPTLVAVSQNLYMDPGGQNFVMATVTWSDPIENTDTSPLIDHKETQIERKVGSEPWGPVGRVDAGIMSISGGILPQDTTVQYRVRAVDGHGNFSTWATSSVVTVTKDSTTPGQASTPVVTAPLSTLKIVWDGLLVGSGALPVDYLYTEVHVSTASGFTPSNATLVGTMRGRGTFLVNALTPGTTYYVRLIVVDQLGLKGAASAQGSASAVYAQLLGSEITDLAITAAKLADNAVTTPKINPLAVTTEKLTVAGFSEQLIANGGMEELSQADATKPAGWGINTVAGAGISAWGTDTSNEDSGDRCIFYTLAASADAGRIYATRPIPVMAGDVYYVSMRVKNSRAAPNANRIEAWTNLDSVNVLNPAHATTTVTSIIGTETGHTGYTTREGTITVPAGKTWMTVAVRGNAAGDGSGSTTYVDQVVVRKLIGDALIVNLTASKITAGTLQADVLLSSKFYTNVSPNARVEMDGLGFRAYDETNKKTIDITGLDGHGDFEDISIGGESNFGIEDPTTGEGSAQITPEGDAAFRNVYADDYVAAGNSLLTLINSLPKGMVARSSKTLGVNQVATGSTPQDLYELSAELTAGRVYRISMDPVLAESNPGSETGGIKCYYTSDGTRPTQSSAAMGSDTQVMDQQISTSNTSVRFNKTFVPSVTGLHRFLFSLWHSSPGASDLIRILSGKELRFQIEDCGAEPPDTGIGPGASLAQTKIFTYSFDWQGDFVHSSGALIGTSKPYGFGSVDSGGVYVPSRYTLLGFNAAKLASSATAGSIQNDLLGYTMNSVKLYLYVDVSQYKYGIMSPWRSASWANLAVYEHALANTSTPATGPAAPSLAGYIAGGIENWNGVGQYWGEPLALSVGDHLKAGTMTGVRINVPDLTAFGPDYQTQYEHFAVGHATKFAYIKINATKY